MRQVDVPPIPPDQLEPLLVESRVETFRSMASWAREVLDGRVVWNVTSTASGGGVAEMLHGFLRYTGGAGIDVRWVVIEGSPRFFEVTKRLHNRIHGAAGSRGELGRQERDEYERTTDTNAHAFFPMIGTDDLVIVHDPQPAGLIPRLRERGTPVVWRCHIGSDVSSDTADEAWGFLREYVTEADALVFSRPAYVPDWVAGERVEVIAPAIDPLSPKNRDLDDDTALALLATSGVVDAPQGNGAGGCRAQVVREGSALGRDVPAVVQVSRWDRLKDMPGVLRGFVDSGVGRNGDAHLLLVGPEVAGVSDDPEGQEVLEECIDAWRALDGRDRASVSLVTVPMDDLVANALTINALQRHATVIVQKSLREGFGLTVAEGMWKARPVVASAVGGILDQVRDGEDGFLLRDPADTDALGEALRTLLDDGARAAAMGASGRERVRESFLPDRNLGQWMGLLDRIGVA